MDNIREIKGLVRDIDPDASILDREGKLLYKLARKCKQGVIVEIGSWKGRSTIWLAKGASVKVYAIDPHVGTDTHQHAGCANTYDEFIKNIVRAGVGDVVVPVMKTSEESVKNWDEPVGLIFIDGDHSYDTAKFDFDQWGTHLVEGGIIALHDTIYYYGPRKVVIENIFKSRDYVAIGVVGQVVCARKVRESNWVLVRNMGLLIYKYVYDLAFRLAKKLPKAVKEVIKNA